MNSLNSGLNYGRPDDLINDFNINLIDNGVYNIILKNPIILANSLEDAYISLDKVTGYIKILTPPIRANAFAVYCDQVASYNSNADKIIHHSIVQGGNTGANFASLNEKAYNLPRFYRLQRTENNIIDSITLTLLIDNEIIGGGAGKIWGQIRLCKGSNNRPYTKNLKRIRNA